MLIRCGCQNVLGELEGDRFEMRHRGRRVIATGVQGVSCEDCGATWTPDAREGRGLFPAPHVTAASGAIRSQVDGVHPRSPAHFAD